MVQSLGLEAWWGSGFNGLDLGSGLSIYGSGLRVQGVGISFLASVKVSSISRLPDGPTLFG